MTLREIDKFLSPSKLEAKIQYTNKLWSLSITHHVLAVILARIYPQWAATLSHYIICIARLLLFVRRMALSALFQRSISCRCPRHLQK